MGEGRRVEKHASTRDIALVFLRHIARYKVMFFFISVSVTIAVIGDLIAPWYIKQFFDVLSSQQIGPEALKALGSMLLMLLGARLVAWLGWRAFGFLTIYFQPRVMADLQISGFTYLLGHSYDFFANSFAGSLVRKIARIGRAFEGLIDEIMINFWPTILVLTSAFAALYSRFPALAYIFLGWTVLFILFNYYASMWKLELDVQRAEADSKVTGALADAIGNSTVIQLYTGAAHEQRLFSKVLSFWRTLHVRGWRRGEIIIAIQSLAMTLLNVGLMWYGAVLWSRGMLTLGDLVLIQTYLGIVMDKLWNIGRSMRRVYEQLADAQEMVDILQLPHGVRDIAHPKQLHVSRGAIAFQDVLFSFRDGRRVLHDFSLDIRAGEKVALVGVSGAGKTTVTKLLLRLYDVAKGSITIDGQDIALVSQESLRNAIALVPQDPVLFHRTLKENIRYGRRGASDREVIEAAKKARCHEFITSLKDGYDTYVGERGVKLSGGERQRVAIARAILKNAPILVLDEATSSLDSESEQLIQEALRELMKDKTAIAIAHRLSTVMAMDRIVVMENGRVVAKGTHDALLGERGMYRKLWNIQAGGFKN